MAVIKRIEQPKGGHNGFFNISTRAPPRRLFEQFASCVRRELLPSGMARRNGQIVWLPPKLVVSALSTVIILTFVGHCPGLLGPDMIGGENHTRRGSENFISCPLSCPPLRPELILLGGGCSDAVDCRRLPSDAILISEVVSPGRRCGSSWPLCIPLFVRGSAASGL